MAEGETGTYPASIDKSPTDPKGPARNAREYTERIEEAGYTSIAEMVPTSGEAVRKNPHTHESPTKEHLNERLNPTLAKSAIERERARIAAVKERRADEQQATTRANAEKQAIESKAPQGPVVATESKGFLDRALDGVASFFGKLTGGKTQRKTA